ncbi:MAG: hypothetical protein E5Y09_02530 [Mesorhizobium sp.]|nr:MAG: hypothetical protein E5Y09_02530 [Mesorhizobium sp.]
MTDRVHCCVPFCRRTCKGDPSRHEWVCGIHWRCVSTTLRRRKSRLFRRYRHLFADQHFSVFPAGSIRRLHAVKLDRLCDKAWERCKRAAIERAAGI